MPIRQQRLHFIKYNKLKNLQDIEISFEPLNITGIFGVNGCGKSTIIHSLLCLFKPNDEDPTRPNYIFSQFFTHTSLSKFIGSNFLISYSYRDGLVEMNNTEKIYSKGDRWKPRYPTRPARNVYFIGISTCVPDIEVEKSKSLIRLNGGLLNNSISNLIKIKAAYILNRDYDEYRDYIVNKKHYIGVRANDISYSSLSMGAGEQRTFKILYTVFNAPNYSLIIIDEIDLTLHTDSLNRLLNVLVDRANEKNLQIVFTSHREEITNRADINIRHIHQTTNKTLCFNQSTPDCLQRLTGRQARTLELFVEDDLAEAIVLKIIDNLGIRRHCSVKRFGAIENSFSLAMGMLLKGEDLNKLLIVLDGDKYVTPEDRLTQMNKKFSGTESDAEEKKNKALSIIRQFKLPQDLSPEQFINRELRNLNDDSEIVETALQINGVSNKHSFVNEIISSLGYDNRKEGLINIVNKISEAGGWADYTREVREWLNSKIQEYQLL